MRVARLSTLRNGHLYPQGSYTFMLGPTGQRGPGPPHCRGFQITHNDTLELVGFLWLVIGPSQHATLTRDRQPSPRRYSNPQFQQAFSRRPSPQTARPLGSAWIRISWVKFHRRLRPLSPGFFSSQPVGLVQRRILLNTLYITLQTVFSDVKNIPLSCINQMLFQML